MPSSNRERSGKGRTDRARVGALTGAEIERTAARDEDNPSTTEPDWVSAAVGPPPAKTPVNAKFDSDIFD